MIKIFALPGAGSSAIIYYKWMKYLPQNFLISPLDIPGRGIKIKDCKIYSNEELIQYFCLEIRKKISDTMDDYVLLGNSFSSILAIQLCKKLEDDKNIHNPMHLFLAVEAPPNILNCRKKMSEDVEKKFFVKSVMNKFFEDSIIVSDKKDLVLEWILDKLYYSKDEFLKLNAKNIYKIIFSNDELINSDIIECINFMLEHLRLFLEDEEIIKNIHTKNILVNTGITVFGATNDAIASKKDLIEWENFTAGSFELEMLQGEHTIIYDSPDLIVWKMEEVLKKYYEQ